jgi:predicted alpha/beta hydrolase family esterase
MGDQGHINVDSGHGEWSAGERYLAELLEEV